ncbi:MAG: hypothetical protein QNJ81_06310 [Acidimicrobiia bacterium]|nr:hypothetical protein [Acidimicrobiia bacterium]
MQSWKALLIAGMLMGPVVGSSSAFASSPSVPASVESTVDAAYAEWYDSLGVRKGCSAGVTIVYEPLSGRRGEYRTRTAEVVIDPNDSQDGLGAIAVHELSHHTFLACGAFADNDFKDAFYAAQGLPEDRDWFDYAAGWSATPAEHFAEAMAITIYGSGEGGISVGEETSTLISRWLAGAPSAPPAGSVDPIPYSPVTGLLGEDGVEVGDGVTPVDPAPTPTSEPPALYRSAVELATRASVSVFSLTHGRVFGPL